jgi:sugar lactone lactonase YvrE
MKKLAIAIAALLAASTAAIAQTSVSPSEAESRPESMAVGPDGTLYIGSQKDARIYRAAPGQAVAQQFIDMRPSAFVLGVLADGPSNTLWACEMVSMNRGSPLLKGKGILRSFDLKSGAPKVNIPLPEETNICNDFVVGPDKALYVADTSNAKVLRLRPGATTFEIVAHNSALYGADGLTFLDGQLYINTVWAGGLYRIPDATSAKPGAPVQIHTPRVLKGPDGMRALNGKMYLAEAGNGTVSEVTIKGDVATLKTIRSGMDGPCALEPHGKTLWVVERPSHRVTAVPIP